MTNLIDMHIHSTYSDGEYDPIDILKMCYENNVTTMAITDHNSIDGSKEALKLNPYSNITVISGIEFSAKYDVKGGDLHILGYGFDVNNSELVEITKNIRLDNVERIKAVISTLKNFYNIEFSDEDLESIFSSKGNIGRPEVAKLCVKYGYSDSVHEAFDTLLIPLNSKLPKRKFEITEKEAIESIINAGGIACLAHPISLKKDYDDTKVFVKSLMEYGLSAIEVYHSKHSKDFAESMLKMANDLNLAFSVGSDYHGPIVSPDIFIGSGKNNNLNFDFATILKKVMR